MRKRLLLLFSAVIIIGGYTLGWFYLSHQLQNRVEGLAQQWHKKGWQVAYQDLRVTGYPFKLNVIVENLELSYKGIVKSWVEGETHVSAAIWRPQQIISWAGGKHHVTFSLLRDNIIHCQGDGFVMQLPALGGREFGFSYDSLNFSFADSTFPSSSNSSPKSRSISISLGLTLNSSRKCFRADSWSPLAQ